MPDLLWLGGHSRHSTETRDRPQLLRLNLHRVGRVEQKLLLRRLSVTAQARWPVFGPDSLPGTALHDREPPCWLASPRPSSPRTSAPKSTPLRTPPRQREGVGQSYPAPSATRNPSLHDRVGARLTQTAASSNRREPTPPRLAAHRSRCSWLPPEKAPR
jgi:hypothetical protein